MNKKLLISIIVVAIAVLAWWMLASKPATAPTADTSAPTNGDNVFTQELNGLDEASVTAEFQAIDADLNQL